MPKGNTSKETVETRSYCKNFFMVEFPWFFGSHTYVCLSRVHFSTLEFRMQ
jgi:hypothetical protein